MGRAARHVNGHVIMYADKRTRSIEAAINETMRRRQKQEEHNTIHGITPTTIQKEIGDFDLPIASSALNKYASRDDSFEKDSDMIFFSDSSKRNAAKQLTKLMEKAMNKFEYEKALVYKEQIRKLKN